MEQKKVIVIDASESIKLFCQKHRLELNSPIVLDIYNQLLNLVDQHIFNDDDELMLKQLKEIANFVGINFITEQDRLDFLFMLASLLKELTCIVVENSLVSVFRYAGYSVGEGIVIEY